jgi:hypothetical protein
VNVTGPTGFGPTSATTSVAFSDAMSTAIVAVAPKYRSLPA